MFVNKIKFAGYFVLFVVWRCFALCCTGFGWYFAILFYILVFHWHSQASLFISCGTAQRIAARLFAWNARSQVARAMAPVPRLNVPANTQQQFVQRKYISFVIVSSGSGEGGDGGSFLAAHTTDFSSTMPTLL